MYRIRISEHDGVYRLLHKPTGFCKLVSIAPTVSGVNVDYAGLCAYRLREAFLELTMDVAYKKHGPQWRAVLDREYKRIHQSLISALKRAKSI